MMDSWRLLDTGVRTAAENMALDESMLEARGQGLAPNTLRFLQFSPPAVLVGYHQSIEQEIRTDFCLRQGIDVNRRITGGGAIFFDESQLGWEIVAGTDALAALGGRPLLFKKLSEGVVCGLRRLGVAASFRPRNDVEVAGRKISGTGGTEGEGAFLFQGTLLLDFDVDTMLRALRVPVEKLVDKEVCSLRERVTWLSRELGHLPPLHKIKEAIWRGFEEVLGVSLVAGGLSPAEERLLREKLPLFASKEWVEQVSSPSRQEVLRSVVKAPGGLVRVALVVDTSLSRIRAAIVTGDFFAYPRRAILDLEAALKDAPAEGETVRAIVDRFFRTQDVYVPGVEAAHFQQAIGEALARSSYGRWGLDGDEASAIFTVGRGLAEMPRCSVLLLPYCAKPLDCAFRHEDGCTQCGLCEIGDAYRLAADKGLKAVSITNYERLQETLARCREDGVEAFIGTCCEAFYAKHRPDFEEAGLPGVLVDIDSATCYDLGQDGLAYKGRFERQTYLRLGLLRKVVQALADRRGESFGGKIRPYDAAVDDA
ncbi:MAG: DUF116 domain-containing protein [Chloroflexi bacterium]|nr:DUF116 domain-containing protein [Chloroflexota bacterium]